MAKSYRTCYRRDWKEFWTPRPLTFFSSNKEHKALCHRVERRVIKKAAIAAAVAEHYAE
uniref:Uncharacterized protein n=1 Tax=Pseudomonas phage RVTF4 TaxID=3236931 RepID=A0AB39CC73_9VIRU